MNNGVRAVTLVRSGGREGRPWCLRLWSSAWSWLPVAVCPDSLTVGWYRGSVAPVSVDQPERPASGGDPGVDDAAVGCEVSLGGAVIGVGRVRQLPQPAAVGAGGEQVGHDGMSRAGIEI